MRRGLAVAVLIVIGVMMTACQVRVVPPPKAPVNIQPTRPVVDVQPAKPVVDPKAPIAATDKPAAVTKVVVYFGLADNHTIEVAIDGNPTALQLTDEIKPHFDALRLKKDDKVEIKYYQNQNKQLVITEIRAAK